MLVSCNFNICVLLKTPFELRVHLLLWHSGMQRRWDALRPPQGIYGWTCALALPLPDIASISLLIFHCLFDFFTLNGFRCRFCPQLMGPVLSHLLSPSWASRVMAWLCSQSGPPLHLPAATTPLRAPMGDEGGGCGELLPHTYQY